MQLKSISRKTTRSSRILPGDALGLQFLPPLRQLVDEARGLLLVVDVVAAVVVVVGRGYDQLPRCRWDLYAFMGFGLGC